MIQLPCREVPQFADAVLRPQAHQVSTTLDLTKANEVQRWLVAQSVVRHDIMG